MEKGQTNNPNGRPKGTPNKATREMKEIVATIVENNIERLQKDIDSLTAKERLDVIVKLIAYIVPKPVSVKAEIEQTTELPTMTLDELRERLKKTRD